MSKPPGRSVTVGFVGVACRVAIAIAPQPKSLRSWNKPTKETFMTYTEWLGHAERRPLSNNDTHYYFRASSGSRRTRFIDRDLKYFDAGKPDSKLFIVDETRQRVRARARLLLSVWPCSRRHRGNRRAFTAVSACKASSRRATTTAVATTCP